MARPAVHVEGLRELDRALRQIDKALAQDLRDELQQAARPVAEAVAQKLVRFRGASTDVKSIALARGVVVRQQARKVTGLRPDFGGVQMRSAFLPAVAENEDELIHELDEALDRFIDRAGF